jgi:uncharacterized protein YcfL
VLRKFPFLVVLILLSLLIAPAGKASALTNLVQDPSLEAAISSTAVWKQNSTNSDTPLCMLSITECNFGIGKTAPRTGSVWALFGGIDWTDPESLSPEIGDLYQNVTFPNSCSATLQFYFWIGQAPTGSDATDIFMAKIDGVNVFTANATQKSSYLAYTLVSVDVSSFANGAIHKVEFYSRTDGQQVIFNLDDVSLADTCFSISGNAGVADATLNYTSGSTTADGSGNYSFKVPSGWAGTVTPAKSGYIFSPENRIYSNIVADQSSQDYTATVVHTISGNAGVSGVTLSYTDGMPKTVTSESNGNYAIVVPGNWSGTVTPSHHCFAFSPTDLSYSNISADQTAQDYTPAPIPGSGCANIDVKIAGANQGSFGIPSQGSVLHVPFVDISNGPVEITSTVSILGSERVFYKVNGKRTSFSELMALPKHQLDTVYWLPWYSSVGMGTQLRLGNVSESTATIHVYIGGVEMSGSPLTLMQGQTRRVNFVGIDKGPIKIVSDVKIIASERVIFKANGVSTSHSELMALPRSQLDTIYWLPWYNNVGLNSELWLGNANGSAAIVHVFIGGMEMTGSPFTVAKTQTKKVSFAGINKGPVQIVSDLKIVASERVIYKVNGTPTSYSELMALPNNQLDTTYWLPWYNNVGLDTQLRFGNASNSTATVHVYIGGTEMTSSPFSVAKGQSRIVSFAGVSNGLLQIVSDVNIIASERVILKANGTPTSYSEMLALPNSQLDSINWLPWYDNVTLDTQLRLGVP